MKGVKCPARLIMSSKCGHGRLLYIQPTSDGGKRKRSILRENAGLDLGKCLKWEPEKCCLNRWISNLTEVSGYETNESVIAGSLVY